MSEYCGNPEEMLQDSSLSYRVAGQAHEHQTYGDDTAKNSIKHIVPHSYQQFRSGTVLRETACMDDGTQYPVVTGLPKTSRSDTAVVFTTAWLTSTKGHNMRTLLRILKQGHTALMIGPEGEAANPELSFMHKLNQARTITLGKTACDMNTVVDHKLSQNPVRQDGYIGLGESRGAMIGMGLNKLIYADFTAPCFYRPPKIHELPTVAGQLVPEIATLGKLAVNLVRPSRQHYYATLHTNPEYYVHEILKIKMLLSGQAGKLALSQSDDIPMHIRLYKNDGWSQIDEWEAFGKERELTRVETVHGYHLDIARADTLDNITKRLAEITQQRGYDGSYENVDFSQVLTAADDTSETSSKFALNIGDNISQLRSLLKF